MSNRSDRAIWKRHRVVVLLIAGAVLAVAAAFLLSLVAEAKSTTITFEFYKLLIQALLIGAVGAFLSAAIQEARRRRDWDERRRMFWRERIESLLRDIEEDYRLIKRSRRMLRLERPIRYSLYRTEMINLEDIRRSLEELETNISRFVDERVLDLAGVGHNVRAMESYLKELWSEFEENAPHSDEEIPLASAPALRGFIADSTRGSFNNLKTSYRAARLALLGKLATIAGASGGKADGPAQVNNSRPISRQLS